MLAIRVDKERVAERAVGAFTIGPSQVRMDEEKSCSPESRLKIW